MRPVGRQTIMGVGREFAGGDLGLPVGALQLVVDDLAAVEPVLDVGALDEDARLVPVIERQHHSGGRTVERVGGRGRREPILAVRRVGVIQQLVFRPAPINVVVFACGAVKNAAVAALADLPFELELEIAVVCFVTRSSTRRLWRARRPSTCQPAGKARLFPTAPVGRARVRSSSGARAARRRRARAALRRTCGSQQAKDQGDAAAEFDSWSSPFFRMSTSSDRFRAAPPEDHRSSQGHVADVIQILAADGRRVKSARGQVAVTARRTAPARAARPPRASASQMSSQISICSAGVELRRNPCRSDARLRCPARQSRRAPRPGRCWKRGYGALTHSSMKSTTPAAEALGECVVGGHDDVGKGPPPAAAAPRSTSAATTPRLIVHGEVGIGAVTRRARRRSSLVHRVAAAAATRRSRPAPT